MAVFTILALNKTTPQFEARPAGNSYLLPVDVETTTGVINSGVADGATANAFVLNSSNALSTAGANLLDIQNNSVRKFAVDKDGKLLISDISAAQPTTIYARYGELYLLYDNTSNSGVKISANTVIGLGASLTLSTLLNYGTPSTITIQGASINANNLSGGDLNLFGQDGGTTAANNNSGGDVVIRGGTGYGTGKVGNIIMATLPTADPLVTGALWNSAGTLKISP